MFLLENVSLPKSYTLVLLYINFTQEKECVIFAEIFLVTPNSAYDLFIYYEYKSRLDKKRAIVWQRL